MLSSSDKIQQANDKVIDILNKGEPWFVGAPPAKEVIPFFNECSSQGKHLITHAGPPVSGGYDAFSGPVQGSMIGICLFEGWSKTVEEAVSLLKSGKIVFRANHTLDGVGSMAGTISENMPVWVCENRAFGTKSFARLSDRFQQFGNYNVLDEVILWRDVIAPAMDKAMKKKGGIYVKPLIEKALQMGDELHNRPDALVTLFTQEMTIAMLEADVDHKSIITTIEFFKTVVWGALSIAMAVSKSLLLPAEDVPHSTIITAICRNGNEIGIRVAGLEKEFFTHAAPAVDCNYICDAQGRRYTKEEACNDLGDSAITETVGFGAPILLGAMALAPFLGVTRKDAEKYFVDTVKVSHGKSTSYYVPVFETYLPVGLDIMKCYQHNIQPVIDTAVSHKVPGIGIVGNGMTFIPMELIKKAVDAYHAKYNE